MLAEGGANFWDAFALVPVSRGFWHRRRLVRRVPDAPPRAGTSFGIALAASFVWTGDTRPIPEMLAQYAAHGELVAHDCALVGNPSHTGVDDLEREYPQALRERLVLYHYASEADGDALVAPRLPRRAARRSASRSPRRARSSARARRSADGPRDSARAEHRRRTIVRGRPLTDLRISVIDRCNFRCPYCMPEDQYPRDHAFLSKADRLRFEEIERLARIFVGLGVRKLRLTGGEPLLRRDLPELVRQLAAIPGVADIAMTTNGSLLAEKVDALRAAGPAAHHAEPRHARCRRRSA